MTQRPYLKAVDGEVRMVVNGELTHHCFADAKAASMLVDAEYFAPGIGDRIKGNFTRSGISDCLDMLADSGHPCADRFRDIVARAGG